MKKNKGFTLVELLAVLVLLAIIMIIAIPTVLNTMDTAKRKTFGEYVTKVYDVAQKKYLSDGLSGADTSYVRYDITKDLDLNNTGNYKGYVVIVNNGDSTDVYIGISDGEYHTATKYADNDASIVNYINYNIGGEPIYTGTLEKFNGENNYFVKGEVNDFDLPEKDNKDSLVTLNKEVTPEIEFENLLKDFYNKSKNTFLNNKGKGNGLVIEQKLENPVGKNYIGFFSYDAIYGKKENTDGYIIIMEDDYNNTEIASKASVVYIALWNDDFHTVSYLKQPIYDSNYNITGYNNKYMPSITILSLGDELPYFKPEFTNNLELIDANFMASIQRDALLEVCKNNNITDCYNHQKTSEENEEFVNIINEKYKDMSKRLSKFVKKSYNDGLTISNYDISTFHG